MTHLLNLQLLLDVENLRYLFLGGLGGGGGLNLTSYLIFRTNLTSYLFFPILLKTTSIHLHSNFHSCSKPLQKTCFSLFYHIKTIYTIEQYALEMTLMQDLCSCRQHRAYDSFPEIQLRNQTSVPLAQVCTLKFHRISMKNW